MPSSLVVAKVVFDAVAKSIDMSVNVVLTGLFVVQPDVPVPRV